MSGLSRFPPDEVPHNPSLPLLEQLIKQFLKSLESMPVEKKLWIVETGRIRVHQVEDREDTAE